MCGRYTNSKRKNEVEESWEVPVSSDVGSGRFNIAPTEQVLAIVAPDGEPEARVLRWGLVPFWAKDLKGPALINARMETVTSKPAFRGLVPNGACRALQVTDGYFEWLKPEKRSEPRQPFYFQVDGGEPFAFASLWTTAHVQGHRVESIVLLTCDSSPNHVAAGIHDRMPVILADRDIQRAWLDESLGAEEALELCGALPASRLSARPVNAAVNKAGVEGPELLELRTSQPSDAVE